MGQTPHNCEWIFQKGKASKAWLRRDQDTGDPVTLPHCWNALDTFQPGVSYYRGWGSYRTKLTLQHDPSQTSRRRIQLDTDGFYGTGELWINGKKSETFDAQYLGIASDISRYLRLGENTLAIRLTNKPKRDVLPGIAEPDFLMLGGLATPVRITEHQDYFINRRTALVKTVSHGKVELSFEVVSLHDSETSLDFDWKIEQQQPALSGPIHSFSETRPLHQGSNWLTVDIDVPNALAWDIDHPTLYRIELQCHRETHSFRVGFRDAEFRSNQGFFLNGRRVELKGINRHERIPGIGNALRRVHHVEDARLIKELGLNFVRFAHYPQSPDFLDACDEFGILVLAEIATWKSVRKGAWLQNALRQMRDMIRRDRAHPSVILWGMGNEAQDHTAYTQLHGLAQNLDLDRATTYAENHQYRGIRHKTLDIPDVLGINYELDQLENARDASKNQSLLVTEISNCPAERGNLAEEKEQIRVLVEHHEEMQNKPWVAGWTLWCLADYGTMRKKRWLRHSGYVDAWRQLKPAAVVLKAMHRDEPVAALFGDWCSEGPAERDVLLVTNQSGILRAGEWEQPIQGSLVHEFQIPYCPEPVLFEASCPVPDTTAAEALTTQLEPHGPGVSQREYRDGPWLYLEILDAEGRRASSSNGAYTASEGFTEAKTIHVARGIGRVAAATP